MALIAQLVSLERSGKGVGTGLHVEGASGILWTGTQDVKKGLYPMYFMPHNENYPTQNNINFLVDKCLVDRLPQFKDAGQAAVIREKVVDQEGDVRCRKGVHAACHSQR